MRLRSWLLKSYFNYFYNPVYDLATGALAPYSALQWRCVRKFRLDNDERILCVGLGTGNEIAHILRINSKVSLFGVDYSYTALIKASQKAIRLGATFELKKMDVQCMDLPDGSYDKVLCIHVMDFVHDMNKVTSEIFRVLKKNGQYVITYPSDREGAQLGIDLFKNHFRLSLINGRNRTLTLLESLFRALASLIYVPLLLRSGKRVLSRRDIEGIVSDFTNRRPNIEKDKVYRDFIVYGRKE